MILLFLEDLVPQIAEITGLSRSAVGVRVIESARAADIFDERIATMSDRKNRSEREGRLAAQRAESADDVLPSTVLSSTQAQS